MQPEYAIPSTDISLPPVSSAARSGDPSTERATGRDVDPDSDERWRRWCARGVTADQHTTRMMNSGFVAILVALSAWLVFQLLA